MNNPKSSPFCQIISGAIDKPILFENETGFVVRDGFPITQGHTLIIPKQHIGSFFGISQTQRQDLFALVDLAQEALADKIEHISLEDDRIGYDIHSYNTNGKDRFIEVKTTNYDRYRQFYISPNELKVSQKLGQDYHLYRVFNFKASPKLFISQGSLDNGYNLSPSAYSANIK